MNKFIFKNIELSQWIKPHLTTYILAADDDELETLQDDTMTGLKILNF